MAKRKKAARIDLATAMLLTEEDFAAMRPALAVAPDLMVQTLARARKRRARKPAKKKVKARKTSAKTGRKVSAKKGRKVSLKRKKAKKAVRS